MISNCKGESSSSVTDLGRCDGAVGARLAVLVKEADAADTDARGMIRGRHLIWAKKVDIIEQADRRATEPGQATMGSVHLIPKPNGKGERPVVLAALWNVIFMVT